MKKNYIIEYSVKDKNGSIIINNKKMKAKNKINSLDAQISFEEFLKKKHLNFGKLIVHKCEEESIMNMFGGVFGDLLK